MSRTPLRITDEAVDRFAYIIDRYDVPGTLRTAMDLSKRGQPSPLSLRTYLIGALASIDGYGSYKSTHIYDVLTKGLSRTKQEELGVVYQDKRGVWQTIQPHSVDTRSKSITSRLLHGARSAPDLSDEERTRRATGLQSVVDAIVQGSLIGPGTGWYALDGSGVHAHARRGPKPNDIEDVRAQEDVGDEPSAPLGSKDLDAAWGSKTSKSGKRENYFGYMLDALVRVAPPGQDTVPLVAEKIVVSPASVDVVGPTLLMLDAAMADGSTVTDIVVDRHYSYKKVDRWADELRARRINQHFDLRSDEQGFRDFNGLRYVAGFMHCPGTPDELGDIPRPGLGASREEHAAFRDRIEMRRKHALDRNTRTGDNGRSQWICPAVRGKVGCPLRESTEENARAYGLPIITNPPALEVAPSCCTNKGGTISVNYDLLRKQEQPHYWGTQEWQDAYDRRSFVEGMFGSLKDHDGTGVRRGFTKFMNLPQNSLSLAFAVAATNLRHQRKFWANSSERPNHPLLSDDQPDYGWIAAPPPGEEELTPAA